MNARLTAYLDGRRVGWFAQEGGGPISFEFDDDWRSSSGRMELTLSMPKSRRTHNGSEPANYLWNLLPDSEPVLERWGSMFGVSPRNPMALLAHVGLDTAGAIQLSPEDAAVLSGPSGGEPISLQAIAAHIRQLRADPEAWLIPGHDDGYFSLAGAQSKFALARSTAGDWLVPTGRAASTHILKPGIRGLDHSDVNEHLSLSAAANLGLKTAASTVEQFEDETVIVVTRYDRTIADDGIVKRHHQEDMAQAAGVHPVGKYQNQGGPGIEQIVRVIRRAHGKERTSDQRFFEATLFNWAILGTDAHAKNYSLLHDAVEGPRLAPLYDVATALPYPAINVRSAKLAMSFGRHYRQYEIEARHIIADAEALGFDPVWAHDRASAIVDGVADAYSDAAAAIGLTGDDAAFAALIVDHAAERAAKLRRELQRATLGSRSDDAHATKQPRTKQGRFDTTSGEPVDSE
ncbi:type II toxin-antitoxin system HipA family toxin [Microbacterium sp. NEAU-LLC]|uniref:Type II toxin-antitoxin system HipA family toxin n=1 Tax=Microbacterium helvum TaxID=2773713 RepID=A0ABR8NRY1_9MICO|nr:type II toxin-antitoxin system HipA family toxin [Microbacterium helvum]MBD3943313.1 type II toxin-antitoxin system HipA family toxin [Microbacterium helvum]